MAYTEAGKFNTRIALKHDIEANWVKATNFIPLKGEMIIYDPDTESPFYRTKIGDGSTKINDLDFADALVGTTEELTPSQVAKAAITGKSICLYYDEVMGIDSGRLSFTSFNTYGFPGGAIMMVGSSIILENIVYTIISTDGDTWTFLQTQLSSKAEVDGHIASLNGTISTLTKRISDLEELINGVGLSYNTSTNTVKFGDNVSYPL